MGETITREIVAYGLIVLIVVAALPWFWLHWQKRKRQKLRRRGNKHFGH